MALKIHIDDYDDDDEGGDEDDDEDDNDGGDPDYDDKPGQQFQANSV